MCTFNTKKDEETIVRKLKNGKNAVELCCTLVKILRDQHN